MSFAYICFGTVSTMKTGQKDAVAKYDADGKGGGDKAVHINEMDIAYY